MKAPAVAQAMAGQAKDFFDRINRIARIEYERMNDRSEAPSALAHGEALMTHIKALEKLCGLGTS
ncbi:MAG: hypothetical protein PVH99_17905 [Desulfobacteraceae bacterium]|jgi:hypothetical protein